MYLLHPVLDITEATIFQHLYWLGIGKTFREEFTKCDVCQRTKRSTTKCGKLPEKLAEEITWNKLCVDLIGPYKIRRKGREPLMSKDVVQPKTYYFSTRHII